MDVMTGGRMTNLGCRPSHQPHLLYRLTQAPKRRYARLTLGIFGNAKYCYISEKWLL
jgi:hypothetical protein